MLKSEATPLEVTATAPLPYLIADCQFRFLRTRPASKSRPLAAPLQPRLLSLPVLQFRVSQKLMWLHAKPGGQPREGGDGNVLLAPLD